MDSPNKPLKFEVQAQADLADWRQKVKAVYKNHRGEISERYFLPLLFEFTTCDCHGTEPTWVCHAWDYDKCDVRSFSMIHFLSPWRPIGTDDAAKYFKAPAET